ncbi:MAG: 50S ribosomal protein L1 [Bacteroidetes bacterium]|nr:50S ribosomal protein L1 [Bacteroidota bacterium]
MPDLTKKRKIAVGKYDREKAYPLNEAAKIVREISSAKFDASVDISVRLGIDPKKPNENIRGTISLPHGTGKTPKILALCPPDKVDDAQRAGADYAGLDEFIEKIKAGWTDVDVIVAMPQVMGKIGALGKILGPKGLMPNPKSGTVSQDIAKAVAEIKKGKIEIKSDKQGILHSTIGKVSFDTDKLTENAKDLLHYIMKLKPATAKGNYLRSVFISSTMSPSVKIDLKTLA